MDITLLERESKKDTKKIRREGFVPAVVYDKSGKSVSVKIDRREFEAHLREIEEGHLATVRFNATFGKEKFTAFVKDVAYHRTTYDIQHIDFMRVKDTDRISVHVPIYIKNADRCMGVKLGAQLKKVKRSIPVSALAKDIPKHFEIDVEHKNLGDQSRVSEIEFTGSVKPKIHPKQVLVSFTKK
jgi:large subunit ribosomal protein L25